MYSTNKQIKIKKMKATVTFKIQEFNSIGTKEINFNKQEDKETTFRNIWKSFTKKLDNNWQSIQFQFEDETILVLHHWLKETNFNFEQSHQII